MVIGLALVAPARGDDDAVPASGEREPGPMLIAQALLSVSMVPCTGSLQPGWTLGSLDARVVDMSFSLACDRVGNAFVTVDLTTAAQHRERRCEAMSRRRH